MHVLETLRNSHKIKRAMRIGRCAAVCAFRRLMLARTLRRRPALRIHFGCGEIADARFLNVDARVFGHVDYVTRSPLMPALPVGGADLIYACHVFEHIPIPAQRDVLRRWRALLRPGGQVMLSVPDFDKVVALYHRGERGFDWMQSVLMGAQDYPGNFHFALFTPARLTALLAEAGFANIRPWHAADEDHWPKDWSWDETLSLNLRAERL